MATRTAALSEMELPPLPLEEWEGTKETLHRYCQIVGKIRMGLSPFRNHWWHVTLYVTPRGLTTGAVPYPAGTFDISFDLLENRLAVTTSEGGGFGFAMDDLPVARFYGELVGGLDSLGIGVSIDTRPFDLDDEHTLEENTHHGYLWPPGKSRFDVHLTTYPPRRTTMGRLDGKTALVTGATSGIGLATARRFADEGAHVFVTGRREVQLDEAVSSIGPAATGIRSDVSDPADLDRVFGAIRAHGAGLDVLFANAGGGEFAPLGEISREHYAETFDRNVAGTLFTVQKALPVLNPGASVVLAGSTSASNGTPAFSVYAASKAAVRSFGRTWAAELVGRGIRVNTLIPGSTVTPGLAGLAPDPAAAESMLQAMAASIPMDRVAQPEEIANAALFLASDESSFMTGGEIFVDGGSEQI